MRWVVLATTLSFATGCFHWAATTSLSSIEDDRVKVVQGERVTNLEHATAEGRTIEGQLGEHGPVERIDVSNARVLVRKLDAPLTIGLIAASSLVVGGVVAFFAILILTSVAAQPDF